MVLNEAMRGQPISWHNLQAIFLIMLDIHCGVLPYASIPGFTRRLTGGDYADPSQSTSMHISKQELFRCKDVAPQEVDTAQSAVVDA